MTDAMLNTLKEKLLHPKDWEQALFYFFDHFANEKAFIEMGKKAKIPIFETLIGELCLDLFRQSPVKIEELQVFKVKEFDLIHGGCFVGNHFIVFIYLTKLHRGVFGIADKFNGNLKHTTRITALPPEELKDEDLLYGDYNEMNPN